jgi:hypothetical protein
VRFNTDCVVCNQFQTVHAAELHRAPNESKKASQSSFTTAAVYLASKRTKSVYGGNDMFTEDNSEYLRLQAVYYCRQTNLSEVRAIMNETCIPLTVYYCQ